MTIARYELAPAAQYMRRGYEHGEYTSPADAIPYTLRWDAATNIIHRAFDHRRSLTIEWPLESPQVVSMLIVLLYDQMAHHQRATLYDDGTCWIYNYTGI